MNKLNTPAQQAIDLLGGVSETKAAFVRHNAFISVQSIYKWLKKGYVPPGRAYLLSILVDGKVSLSDLLKKP